MSTGVRVTRPCPRAIVIFLDNCSTWNHVKVEHTFIAWVNHGLCKTVHVVIVRAHRELTGLLNERSRPGYRLPFLPLKTGGGDVYHAKLDNRTDNISPKHLVSPGRGIFDHRNIGFM